MERATDDNYQREEDVTLCGASSMPPRTAGCGRGLVGRAARVQRAARGGGMDVRSIMMLIHAAEELHGGPAAYAEAGILGLDRPITAVCACPAPRPHPFLLAAIGVFQSLQLGG